MKSKNGFLLIELLFSVVIMVTFINLMLLFISVGIKNRDLAIKRVEALELLQNTLVKTKKNNGIFKFSVKNIAQINFDLGFYGLNCTEKLVLKKVMVKGIALGKKNYSVFLIC